MPAPLLPSSNPNDIPQQLNTLLHTARTAFAARQIRKALDTLHAAHSLATAHGLHRQATHLKRAFSILANNGRPKLLTRPNASLESETEP